MYKRQALGRSEAVAEEQVQFAGLGTGSPCAHHDVVKAVVVEVSNATGRGTGTVLGDPCVEEGLLEVDGPGDRPGHHVNAATLIRIVAGVPGSDDDVVEAIVVDVTSSPEAVSRTVVLEGTGEDGVRGAQADGCLLYTSPSPRD